MEISVRLAGLIPTRPCDFCLAFQDDSVFADFALDNNNRVYLLRISYDGYGCNYTDGIASMKPIDSKSLIDAVKKDVVNSPHITSILLKYFDENKEMLWEEALFEHELLLYSEVAQDNKNIIYVPLLGEGTSVWRPTIGVHVKENEYVVCQPNEELHPDSEERWAFLIGSHVICHKEKHDNKLMLVAKQFSIN